MEKQRTFFVIDMKTFFASVECAERNLDPFKTSLVVADESRGKNALCLAISPKMKALGIRNRCRLSEIPSSVKYIIAKPRMQKYIDYAAEIYGIYLKYIDKNDIHVYSIDESFIDATDYLKIYNLTAKEFAKKLMKEIWDTLHIPCSTGVGTNMFLAKIALDITAKHSSDFIGYLDEDKFKKELWNHTPITDFWQISTGTENTLKKHGINTLYDIAHTDEAVLYKLFGINAELLIDHANGKESCLISDIKKYKRKTKSISSSQILPKNYNYDDALIVLKEMLQSGCYELYKQHYVTNLIHIDIGYGDYKTSAKASRKLNFTTNLYYLIVEQAERLFEEIVDKNKPIRKIGFTYGNLADTSHEQYDMFTDLEKVKKEKRLVESVLQIKNKYGKSALLKAIDFEENATQRERNKLIGGHNSE